MAAGRMPNHVHALLYAGGGIRPTQGSMPRNPLGDAVGLYKSRVANLVRAAGIPFAWQTGYHDRIVAAGGEWDTAVAYIRRNPQAWWEKYGESPPFPRGDG